MRPIFLLTDFGVGHYRGVVRAVIRQRFPGGVIEDLSHDVSPGQVREAAYLLEAAWPYLPNDAVVVAVVDPGVGTDRAILAMESQGRCVLAPDNGLLTGFWLEGVRSFVAVDRPDLECKTRSRTFHGRDVFAPIAAAVAQGSLGLSDLGGPVSSIVCRHRFGPTAHPGGGLELEVVHVDRFGNVITDLRLPPDMISGSARIAHETIHRFVGTFGEAEPGQAVLYRGSSGHLEVAVRDGNAAARFGVSMGDRIQWRG